MLLLCFCSVAVGVGSENGRGVVPVLVGMIAAVADRSEERRVGKECRSPGENHL